MRKLGKDDEVEEEGVFGIDAVLDNKLPARHAGERWEREFQGRGEPAMSSEHEAEAPRQISRPVKFRVLSNFSESHLFSNTECSGGEYVLRAAHRVK